VEFGWIKAELLNGLISYKPRNKWTKKIPSQAWHLTPGQALLRSAECLR